MKCVCGYDSHERDWEITDKERKKFERFITINGAFFIRENTFDEKRVSLSACPKCFTIKMDN